jgi:hypothetical protein
MSHAAKKNALSATAAAEEGRFGSERLGDFF